MPPLEANFKSSDLMLQLKYFYSCYFLDPQGWQRSFTVYSPCTYSAVFYITKVSMYFGLTAYCWPRGDLQFPQTCHQIASDPGQWSNPCFSCSLNESLSGSPSYDLHLKKQSFKIPLVSLRVAAKHKLNLIKSERLSLKSLL